MNPVPKQARKRPPETRATVAMPEAMVITDRRPWMRTAVLGPMRVVRRAARARWTKGSSHSGAES